MGIHMHTAESRRQAETIIDWYRCGMAQRCKAATVPVRRWSGNGTGESASGAAIYTPTRSSRVRDHPKEKYDLRVIQPHEPSDGATSGIDDPFFFPWQIPLLWNCGGHTHGSPGRVAMQPLVHTHLRPSMAKGGKQRVATKDTISLQQGR